MGERFDVVIVGAGVVGCAVAYHLSGRGLEVLVVDQAAREGGGLTSRNSGVVHSGLYYPPGSLKANLCLEGQGRLYDWCERHDVSYMRCGKLVVADPGEEERALERLAQNAEACGASGLELLSWSAALELEPALATSPKRHALWCPNSGVVDPHGLTHSLRRAAERRGVDFAFRARVQDLRGEPGGWTLRTERGSIRATSLINAAGLAADRLAHAAGLEVFHHRYSRGDYYRWHGAPAFERLIYPVRRRGSAGLGVHVTLELDGGVRLGPDAKWVDKDEVGPPSADLHQLFTSRVAGLLGRMTQGRLSWDGCGTRPKLFDAQGRPVDDFQLVQHRETSWHLLGVESPGLTAALALGRVVAERVALANP